MPRFEITSPDGKKFEITAPDGATQDQVLEYARTQFQTKTDPLAAAKSDPIGAVVNTVSEPITSLATGTAGAALGGLAGLAASAVPGLRQGIGRDVSQAVSHALTYEPRSTGGKAVLGAIAKPFEWLAGKADQAGGATAEAMGSPLAGTAVNTGIQAAPLLLGRAAKAVGALGPESTASQTARLTAQSINSVKDNTLAAARAEGFVVPPSAIQGSFVGNRVEGVGGKAAIGQEATLRNQQAANKVARREAGLAENDPISEGTLAAARDNMAGPYREVAAVSPRAASAFEKLKEARAEAKTYWTHYERSADPKSLNQARLLDGKAEMLEKLIDREATRAGSPDLLARIREARTAMAKNFDVERALNLGSGDVDPAVFGRMLDRGHPLTGGLETIGRFAQAFKPYARDAATVPTPGVSKLESVAATSFGMGGHASGLGWLPAGLPLLSGPARSVMLSDFMQKPRTYEQSLLSRLASNPGAPSLLSAVPISGGLAELQRQ
jgi:hypothetical protein